MLFGIGWLNYIIMIITFALVTKAIYKFYNGDKSFDGLLLGFSSFIGFCLAALVFLVLCGPSTLVSQSEHRWIPGHTTSIAAMDSGTDNELHGLFLFGCGGINSESVISYKYLAKVSRDFEMRKLNANGASHIYVREESSTPRLEKSVSQYRYVKCAWLPEFLWIGLAHPFLERGWTDDSTVKPIYRFFVPEGTVHYGYNVTTK